MFRRRCVLGAIYNSAHLHSLVPQNSVLSSYRVSVSALAKMALTEIPPISKDQSLGLASVSEAHASACVSIYSRIFVSLPFRTAMSKTQSSMNVLLVALISPWRRRWPEPGLLAPRIREALGKSFRSLWTPSEAHFPVHRA